MEQVEDRKDILFSTPRLVCRRIDTFDLEALEHVYGDAEAMKWVGDGQPLTHELCLKWIDVTKKNYIKRGYGMSALELKNSREVVGFCGIVHPNQQKEPEVKYAFVRKYWGLGFATEAVSGLLEYGFNELQLSEIFSTTFEANTLSNNVLRKNGFEQIDRRSEAGLPDVIIWKISRI